MLYTVNNNTIPLLDTYAYAHLHKCDIGDKYGFIF